MSAAGEHGTPTAEQFEKARKGSGADREQRVLQIIETARAKPKRFKDDRINMAHGAGGKATQALIEGLLLPAIGNESLVDLGDSGAVEVDGTGLAMSTDSFVVRPIRFPGGSIGGLAINGTVNDLAVAGARPAALTLSLILEEGLDAEVLKEEIAAIAAAAEAAEVEIISGDTKVVERGHCDQMYINTTGLGLIDERAQLSTRSIRPGDRVLVSGSVGEHGTAIMFARDEFELDADVESDTCSLWPAVDALLEEAGPGIRCMRDATRGGIASALNELSRSSGVAVHVREAEIPVSGAVAGASELLGIDPAYVANEGKLVAFVDPDSSDAALAALRSVDGCDEAAEIGEVKGDPPGMVLVETAFGGRRVMDLLAGDPLPRIC